MINLSNLAHITQYKIDLYPVGYNSPRLRLNEEKENPSSLLLSLQSANRSLLRSKTCIQATSINARSFLKYSTGEPLDVFLHGTQVEFGSREAIHVLLCLTSIKPQRVEQTFIFSPYSKGRGGGAGAGAEKTP